MNEAVALSLPEEVIRILGENREWELKRLATLELYRERKITLRQAAQTLNVSYRRMMEILAEYGIYINYGEQELAEDMAYAFGSERL